MHSLTVSYPPSSSTVVPDPQTGLWSGISDETGINALPEIFREIVVETAQVSRAAPSSVAAVTLCLVALGLGPGAKVSCPGGRAVSSIFNVVIRHGLPQSLPWFDYLSDPLINRALAMLSHYSKHGPVLLQKDLAKKETEYQAARKTVAPDPELLARLKTSLARDQAGLAPMFVINRASYQTVANAVTRTFDGGILMQGIQIDSVYEFTQLKRTERFKIIELLNQSWAGHPLTIGTRTDAAVVSALWQTTVPVKTLVSPACFDPGFFSPPILIHEDRTGFHRLPKLRTTGVWEAVMNKLLDERCGKPSGLYSVAENAESLFSCFEEEIAHCSGATRYSSWLPELSLRLALLFHILSQDTGTVVAASVVQNAITATKWIGCQHLKTLTAETGVSQPAAPTDPADKAAVMLAKIRSKAPLTRRELWRSYNAPKSEWFDRALNDLIATKQVRYTAENQLVPCSGGGDGGGGTALQAGPGE